MNVKFTNIILWQRIMLFLKKFFNVYLFLRERNRVQVEGGAEKEGDTESEAGFRL